jgi:hypothetical protein
MQYISTNKSESYGLPYKIAINSCSENDIRIELSDSKLVAHKRHDESIVNYVLNLLTKYDISPIHLFGVHNPIKEMSESGSVLQYHDSFNFSGSVVCYVVGEGVTPRVSYLLALMHPDWMIVSMDPMLDMGWRLPLDNLLLLRMFDYEVDLSPCKWFDRVICMGVHSHNDMAAFYNKIMKPKLLIALPCCVSIDLPNPYEIRTLTGVFSGKNIMYSWKTGTWDRKLIDLTHTHTQTDTFTLNPIPEAPIIGCNGGKLECVKAKSGQSKLILTFDRNPLYLNYLLRFLAKLTGGVISQILFQRSMKDIIFTGMLLHTLNIYIKDIETVLFVIDHMPEYDLILKILVSLDLRIVPRDYDFDKDHTIIRIGSVDMIRDTMIGAQKQIHLVKELDNDNDYARITSYLFGYTNTVYWSVRGLSMHSESRFMQSLNGSQKRKRDGQQEGLDSKRRK